jgi:hypothetical protein
MSIHDADLTDAQIDALAKPVHIVTNEGTVTRPTWVMLLGRRYVATVYSPATRNSMIKSGRADRAIASEAVRHPAGTEVTS